jgi:WD40 repeat protein/tRNA A-37 threonylcarbamoyl transferase component Bud32/tetratricopeptide (TPR) repeat protein
MNSQTPMNQPDAQREEALFQAAAQLTGPARESFLDNACQGNPALRQRLEALLTADAQSEGVLAEASPAPGPTMKLDSTESGDEAVGQRIGRYKILEKVGEGGWGVVYVAEQTEPVRRRVALKVIKLGMDTKAVVARFEAERQALAMMDHPNIAKVLDAGATETGRPYFVMELVRGIRITDYCDQNSLPTKERLELFMKVCQAIQHAHQKGIIHRDIKPSNILVTLHDGLPVPKVIDFGIAKATEGRLTDATVYTQLHQFIGTPAYMSPEQAEMSGLDIDTRSDIYSLGVLLYELLIGKTPFDAKELLQSGLDEMRRRIREEEPLRPSTRVSTMADAERTSLAKHRQADSAKLVHLLRGDLDWIVMKCLEKDRTRRYETANGLAADIRRFLGHEPVTAVAPSAAYRLRKFAERNRRSVLAAAIIVVLLLAGITASTWLAVLATHARNNATQANQQLTRQVSETEQARGAERGQRLRAEGALQRMQTQKAEELLRAGQAPLGLAYLGAVLRANPSNRVAADRLVSALLQRRFPVLLARSPLVDGLTWAEVSPDGERFVTVSYGTARVWDSRTGRPLTEPFRPTEWLPPVQSAEEAVFSPDGQLVATFPMNDKTPRIWDSHTGQALSGPLRHQGGVLSTQFSPEGQRVVTACIDGTARVWDARSGQPLTEFLRHEGPVYQAEFSPEGERVVTAEAKKVRIWDARSGQRLIELPEASAHFSPDGQRLVTCSTDGTAARVWDARTGQPLAEPIRPAAGAWSANFSPDGQRVLTRSGKNDAQVWDARTGQPLSAIPRQDALVRSVEFSPDGERLVTISDANVAMVWDAHTGAPLLEPVRHEGPIFAARFSSDGQRLMTTAGGTAAVWDVRAGQPLTEPFRHGAGVLSAQFSSDGQRVVTACYDRTARVWDVRTARMLIDPLRHGGPVRCAQFSSDGKRVATGSDDRTARVWDAQTGQPLTKPLTHRGPVEFVRFNPDGQRVVTISLDYAQVWDARTGERVNRPIEAGRVGGTDALVSSAQFSPDGLRIVTGSLGGRIWDARTGQPLTERFPNEDPALPHPIFSSAQFSRDGQRVVTAGYDGTAQVWDARTGKALTEPFRHAARVRCAEFSPDGERVVTASEDKTARVWDARTGQPLTEPLRHERPVASAQFSPDGERVVTASQDKTARVWDARTGQPITEPFTHQHEVLSAQFSPDGERVVTASMDGTARVWDTPVAPLPVPNWFIEWAEGVGGRRFDSQGTDVAVPADEQSRWLEKLASPTDTSFYVRLARWVESDVSTRSISPSWSETVPEYVKRRIEENTLESLRDAVKLSCTNALAFARLAVLAANQDSKAHPGCLEEAEFYARFGLKHDEKNAEAWRTLAAVQLQADKTVEALQSISRALELQPESVPAWEFRGKILEKSDRPSEALAAYTRGIDLLPATNNTVTLERYRALLNRARVLRRLDRVREAIEDTCAACRIPARDPQAGPNLVDLTASYNGGLTGSWHGERTDNDLSQLPKGIQTLAGTTYDLRGLIQLTSKQDPEYLFPDQVTIPIAHECRRIHFLHSAAWGFDPVGTVIGEYVMHYADGAVEHRPLALGKDLLDWWERPAASSASQEPRMAWTGENGWSRELGKTIQLFVTAWDNPRPDASIVSIDFVSTKQTAGPFLVAITTE